MTFFTFDLERWQSTWENRVRHNLSESGVHPLTVRELLDLAGAAANPVLDVRLGDTDGPTLYTRLCERWGSAPPVILVTAERDEALRTLALERGWGFLAKPVKPAALRALMTQLHVRRAR